MRFPPVPEELLKALEEAFPNRLPNPGTCLREVDMLIGTQQVVGFLRSRYEEQNTNVLEEPLL